MMGGSGMTPPPGMNPGGMMGGGGGGMMGGGTGASAAPATPAATGGPVATRLAVTLSDALTITPSAMTVPHGVAVTFVVTNTGTVLHEFTLGSAEEQAAHEAEMQANGGMTMVADEPMAIGVQPGQTKELTVTFATPGSIIAGCHVAGHYAAGMHATLAVE